MSKRKPVERAKIEAVTNPQPVTALADPEDRTAIPDLVYARIRQQILTCQLAPGMRIIESEFCERLAVSRTPLREALNRLASEALVKKLPYRGYTVTPISESDIVELCELRTVVEGSVAALAAQRSTPDEVDRLEQLAPLDYIPGDRTTYELYLQANRRFHAAVARCARNGKMEALVLSLLDQLQRPFYLRLDIGLPSEEATAEHLEVVDAIRQRNPVRAQSAHVRQLESTRVFMLRALGRSGAI